MVCSFALNSACGPASATNTLTVFLCKMQRSACTSWKSFLRLRDPSLGALRGAGLQGHDNTVPDGIKMTDF